MTVVNFCGKKRKYTFSACYNIMVMERSRCREEPTKNYIKLVLAPQMGRGIMLSGKLSGNPVHRLLYAAETWTLKIVYEKNRDVTDFKSESDGYFSKIRNPSDT